MNNKYFIVLIILSFICIYFVQQESYAKRPLPQLLFFYSDTCHVCHKIIQEIMPDIEREFFDRVSIEYLNIADINNYKLMLELKEKYGCKDTGIPIIFIEGNILVGSLDIKQNLRRIILEVLDKGIVSNIDKETQIDLVKRFLSFGILTIMGAGLIDGINPCAFSVIVFFISFLYLQGYRKKELGLIGISFILAVFLIYVSIGLGIFRFLYAMRNFYFLSKILYYLIGSLCFILAGLCFYDLWVFKKTGKFEGMTLQLPQVIKNRIHYIIGMHYRKNSLQKTSEVYNPSLFKLIVSAFITGSLVSILEAVCTGQLYLPIITFMLKEPAFRIRAFFYLLIYNLMFIIPLFLVLLFAILGTTSEGFSRFMKRHILAVKLFMALLFVVLGIFIIMWI